MKHKRIFRILAVALTLALLLVAIPASPALAYSVNVDPDDGTIGDTIRVYGTDSVGQELNIYFSSDSADVGNAIDAEVTAYEWLTSVMVSGITEGFSVTNLKVPSRLTDGDDVEDVHGGIYYIYITRYGSKDIKAKATFFVTGVAEVFMDIDEGPVGTEVEISGEGFAPGEDIVIEYDGDELEIESGDEEADNDGDFELTIIIPESTYGEHTITIKGQDSLAEVEESFFVEPEINFNPVSGEAGTTVTISGTGFDRRNGVDFYFAGSPITVVWLVESGGRTNSDGTFAVNIVVPDVAPGNYTVLAEDEDDDDISAQRTFAVTEPPLNPAITVSPTSGNVGDEVTVDGTEFSPDATVTLYFDNVSVGTVVAGSDGSFSGSLDIPAATRGSHTIRAEDSVGRSATATVTVEPEMAFDIEEGPGGTEVTVTGTGFGYRSNIVTVDFDGDDLDIERGDDEADIYGSFEFSFVVPAVGPGTYDIEVGDEDGNKAEAEFTIVATTAAISPATGVSGTEVTVSGTGFIAGSTITITYYLEADATTGDTEEFIATAISDGTFSTTYTPVSEGGNHNITISDGTNSVTVSFTVIADAAIEPTSGSVDEEILVLGTGFGANKAITITYDGSVITPVTPIVTNEIGLFVGGFIIPASAGGDHTITVSDGDTTEQFVFVMESIPPQSPVLLLIYLGTRAEQPLFFDWSDINDDSSPVIYNLEVATDANFSNVVLEKTELAESKYTLTEAEELDKVSKDNPYYWRVNAVDSAGNISDWSDADSFYIGGGWPGWLMWLWIGLGAMVIFILALWLGRRIAYASY